MKGEFIKAFHKHRQEHYRGLSEGFLWHSTCQDNTIGHMWQVHLSAVMTRQTRFFEGTGILRLYSGPIVAWQAQRVLLLREKTGPGKKEYHRALPRKPQE